MQIVLNIEDTVASTVEHEARKEGLPLDTFIENLVETTFLPTSKKTELPHTTMIEALGNEELGLSCESCPQTKQILLCHFLTESTEFTG